MPFEVQVTTRSAHAKAPVRGDLFDSQCPTRQLLPGVSQKMLSVTLQNLARDGLVARRVEPTVPPRVHYRLTELGLSLEIPPAALRDWAEDHMAEIERANSVNDAHADR
ncbi:helix-turn-helix transcriptional regulator [Nocardia sp. 2]|uniref:Helix-turn-helix transcriptional regulator n=1 Tax=Nocardia acididurans TaxID=2802282 RepID=A0ABS1M8C9_9NOCA|nr:helix-turn-helix domain-containing protein [Nocardia acididurans]MBL1076893.1 helix-turn-helix transcriptional regulator [Nocardia acididurans]